MPFVYDGRVKRAVAREKNKRYYRALHVPIWIWVFFVLPGPLTYRLYRFGPNREHWIWLAMVALVCAWRGWLGRLPGAETKPYVTYYGVEQPNLAYRVVCYTAAWIDLLVPYTLNLIGLLLAVFTGRWRMAVLYDRWYYAAAGGVVVAAVLNLVPRARRSTRHEGAERAWFYLAVWTVVPAQALAWGMWRLGGWLGLPSGELNALRLGVFLAATAVLLTLGLRERLPRTQRYYDQPAFAGI